MMASRRLLAVLCASMFLFTAACGASDEVDSSADRSTTITEDDTSTTEDTTTTTTEDDSSTTEDDSSTTTNTTDDDDDPASDDDETTTSTTGADDDTETDDDTTTTTGVGTQGDGSNPEFCEAGDELERIFDNLGEDDVEGFVDAIDGADDLFDAYVEAAPDELGDDAELVIGAVRDVRDAVDNLDTDAPDVLEQIQTETTRILSDPEVESAGEALETYTDTTCGTG